MRLTITTRLFLAMLLASSIVVVSMLLILQWSVDRGFLQYVNTVEQQRLETVAEELESYYAEHASWAALSGAADRWQELIAATQTEGRRAHRLRQPPPNRPLPPPPEPGQRFETRLLLFAADRQLLIGPDQLPKLPELRPLHQGGTVVGYLGLLPRQRLSDLQQQSFLKKQKLAMVLVAGVMLAVAAALSLWLARRLLQPIREVAAATRQLAGGDYQIRVPVATDDELGRLAQDFNALALSLEQTEQTRRQWVADISHELRTPLAILRGEIEALTDGVRQADAAALTSLHGEVLRLQRLVDDLYQLALSDVGALTYRKGVLDLAALVRNVAASYRETLAARQLTLTMTLPDERLLVHADRERLHQLFANLLDNTCHYTDPGGQVVLEIRRDGKRLLIDLRDSAPGVPPAALDKLFDRLYRVEGSRRRSSGGAGLGLAICRNIVAAHEGTISAQAAPEGGLWIRVTLPCQDESP